MTQHTAGPWTNKASASGLVITKSYPDNGDYSPIATAFKVVDAEFIVRACNCFDDMRAVLLEAEERSRKRLPVKKSTWLKMCNILQKVDEL